MGQHLHSNNFLAVCFTIHGIFNFLLSENVFLSFLSPSESEAESDFARYSGGH